MVHAQKIAADTVCRFQRAEVFLIIFMQLAAQMQPNLVQHAWEINHAARHFFGTFWIGSHRQMNRIIPWRRNFCGLLCLASRQRQNSLSLRTVIERMKPSDFIETTNGIKGVEKTCVAGRKLARLEVTATQVCVAKCLGTLPGEKVKTQPAAVGRRDALRFPEKGDEQQQNQVSVHLRLKLKVARKIFRRDLALSAFELERRVQRVVEFF